MGENEYNNTKLNEFINQVNRTTDNGRSDCHLLVIPPGIMPSEMIMTSPLYSEFGGTSNAGNGNANSATPGANPFAEYGGFDPSVDPEMAMAMRISLEEARNAAAAVNNASTTTSADNTSSSSSSSSSSSTNPTTTTTTSSSLFAEGLMNMDNDEALQAALALSMSDSPVQVPLSSSSTTTTTTSSSSSTVVPPTPMVNPNIPSSSYATPAPTSSSSTTNNPVQPPQAPSTEAREPNPTPSPVAVDAEFARSLLADLPGVDINDPTIMAMLASLSSGNTDNKDDKSKSEKKDGQ